MATAIYRCGIIAAFLMCSLHGFAQSPELIWVAPGHASAASTEWSLTVAPKEDYVVTVGDLDGTVKLWTINGKYVRTIIQKVRQRALNGSFSADGSLLLVKGTETADIYNVSDGKLLRSFRVYEKRHGGMLLAGGKRVLLTPINGYTSDDSSVVLYDAETGKMLANLQTHIDMRSKPLIVDDSAIILGDTLFADIDGRPRVIVRLFDAITGRPVRALYDSKFDDPLVAEESDKFMWTQEMCCHTLLPGGRILMTFQGVPTAKNQLADSPANYCCTAVLDLASRTLLPVAPDTWLGALRLGPPDIWTVGHMASSADLRTFVLWQMDFRTRLPNFMQVYTADALRPTSPRLPFTYENQTRKPSASQFLEVFPFKLNPSVLTGATWPGVGVTNSRLVVFEGVSDKIPAIISARTLPSLSLTKQWLANGTAITAMAVSTNGQSAIAGLREGVVRLFSIEDGTTQTEFKSVTTLGSLSANDRYIAGGAMFEAKPRVFVWDFNGKLINKFRLEGSKGMTDTAMVMTAGTRSDGGLRLYDIRSGKAVQSYKPIEPVWRFAVSGTRVAAISNNRIRVWEIESAKLLYDLTSPVALAREIAFDDAHNQIVVGGQNGRLFLMSLDDPQQPRELKGHGGPIFGLSFAMDGKFVVSRTDDVTDPLSIRVWSTSTLAQIAAYEDETRPACLVGGVANVICVVPKSGSFVYGRGDGTVVLAKLPK